MNILRAKEIVESPETITVTLYGTPIYIQQVDEKNETARVFPIDDPQDEKTVSINSLEEAER
ncbi:MAG TPA: H-type small acid-soluble spore protein [Bacillaceae bacterium]